MLTIRYQNSNLNRLKWYFTTQSEWTSRYFLLKISFLMKPVILNVTFSILILLSVSSGDVNASHTGDDYLPGRIMVNIVPESGFSHQQKTNESGSAGYVIPDRLAHFFEPYKMLSARPVFGSQAYPNLQTMKKSRSTMSDRALEVARSLQNTYSISYESGHDPAALAALLENEDWVVYAEPHFIHKTLDDHSSFVSADMPENHPSLVTSNTSDDHSSTFTGYSPGYSPVEHTAAVSRFIPNDPLIGLEQHNYFDYLNLYKAWSIQKGSPDVVIAIVDSGVYYDHPDLRANLWRNPEPGRADDFFPEFDIQNDTIGWNFWASGDIYAGEDPVQNADPSGDFSTHGTRVAGMAAAVTDNGFGMAGVGFQSRFMPVKVGGTKQYPRHIAYGYYGILYAAVNGADVINCSFAGAGRSRFGKDVIEFATESGSLIVAAIGNDGIPVTGVFPAMFDDVLAVGAVSSNHDDKLASFSNYGYKVDVFVVGRRLISTTFHYDETTGIRTPDFIASSGTSLSSPIVSGLAALIKAQYPDWPAQQIASQIRGTARSIYYANPDATYRDKLGSGVIDAYAALTEDVPVISFTGHRFLKNEDLKINTGETGTLFVDGVHFGRESPELIFRLEALQTGTTVLDETTTKTALGPGERFTLEFPVSIHDDYRLDNVPKFRLAYSPEGMDDDPDINIYIIEYEELLYGVLDNNKLIVSIPPDGSIGFINAEERAVGLGFIPGSYENVLSEAGLMIGGYREGEKVVINQVRDSTGISRHFYPTRNTHVDRHPGIRNALRGQASFASVGHPAAKELSIELEALTINSPDIDMTLLLTYRIQNNSDFLYSDLHFGLFNHWEMEESGIHHTNFDEDNHLLYVVHQKGQPYVGVSVAGDLSGALAINNRSGMTLSRAENRSDSLGFGTNWLPHDDRYDGFTDAEKFLALTAGTERTVISTEDLSTVISTGPYTLYPHSEVTIGFIYAWGFSAQQLRNQVSRAREMDRWEKLDYPGDYSRTGRVADEITLHPGFPNPFNGRTNIRFDITEPGHVDLMVYNMMGERVATLISGTRERGPHFTEFDASMVASGLYIIVLRTRGRTQSQTVTLIK